jgi:hypothetical protein
VSDSDCAGNEDACYLLPLELSNTLAARLGVVRAVGKVEIAARRDVMPIQMN